MMGFFGSRKKAAPAAPAKPSDPKWVTTAKGGFHQLMRIDPDEMNLRDVGGVYVIWHGGTKPEWLFVGESPSIARAIDQALDMDEITEYESMGRVYVTWSPIQQDFRRGVLLYLAQSMKPLIPNPRTPKEGSVDPVPVLAPGAKAAA